MSCVPGRFACVAFVFTLLSGCGSGSGSSGGTTPPPAAPVTVTFTITGDTPSAVATQIGSSPFTAATLSGGKVTLTLASGTTSFAVAYLCADVSTGGGGLPSQDMAEDIVQASTLDGTSFSGLCGDAPSATSTGTLTGSVDASAIPESPFIDVVADNGNVGELTSLTSPGASFSFAAPTGINRVNVLANNATVNDTVFSYAVTAVRNFNSQMVPGALNGGNPVVLGPADQVTQQPITYSGLPSGFRVPSIQVDYQFSTGVGYLLTNGSAAQYPAVPSAATQPGDFYSLSSSAQSNDGAQGVAFGKTWSTAGPIAVAFPTPRVYAGPTPAALPVFDLTYTGFSGSTGLYHEALLTWQLNNTSQAKILMTATGSSMDGATSLKIPDLSGVNGFLAPPVSGTAVDWEATVVQGPLPYVQPQPSNSTTTTVYNVGIYNVP